MPDAQVSYLLYPNPARDELTLQRAHCDGCSATLTLTDAAGHLALRISTTQDIQVIDLSALPAGVYLAEVLNEDGARWQSKFVRM